MVPRVFPEGIIRKSFAPGGGDRDGQSYPRPLPRIVAKTILRRARVMGVAWLYQACICDFFDNQGIIWQHSKPKGACLGDGKESAVGRYEVDAFVLHRAC